MKIDHLRLIRQYWDRTADDYQLLHHEHRDESMHPSWGLWHVPESVLNLYQQRDLSGLVVLELGCGAGHDSIGLAMLGASVIGVDISIRQLAHAKRHPGVAYMVCCAEKVPLQDSSVDIVVSDHGAFDHSPVEMLLQECVRVLKPQGRLIICTYSPLAHCCFDGQKGKLTSHLQRKYPTNSITFAGELPVCEYSMSHWISSFRRFKFQIERLEELVISENVTEYFGELVDTAWSKQWPCDIVWVLSMGAK